jgi:tetratricopeptide (TPR) repeat protein
MKHSVRLLLAGSALASTLIGLAACDSKPHESSVSSAQTAALAASQASAKAASAASTGVPAAQASALATAMPPGKGKPKPSMASVKSARQALTEGRSLAKEKEWPLAIAKFEAALKLTPSDAQILSELGYALYFTKDYARAEKVNHQAIAAGGKRGTTAAVWYNQGLVYQATGDRVKAKAAFQESLALRSNKTALAAFTALGGKETELGVPPVACPEATSASALCTCLSKSRDFFSFGQGPTCSVKAALATNALGTWEVLSVGSEQERAYFLTLKTKDKMMTLGEVGADYEPGAFGVHNESSGWSFKTGKAGASTHYAVEYTVDNEDTNMAGLELCSQVYKETLLCAESAASGLACRVLVRTEMQEGCSAGVEPEPSDQETLATVAELKKGWSTKKAAVEYSVLDTGAVRVKLASGEASIVPPGMIGEKRLCSGACK